jgi:hypothetical protein
MMADYTAIILENPPILLSYAQSFEAAEIIKTPEISLQEYLISAWNLTTTSYETWISSDPNSAAPSGNPTGERIVKEL